MSPDYSCLLGLLCLLNPSQQAHIKVKAGHAALLVAAVSDMQALAELGPLERQ